MGRYKKKHPRHQEKPRRSLKRRQIKKPTPKAPAKRASKNKRFFILFILLLGLLLYSGRHFLFCLYEEKPDTYITKCSFSGRKVKKESHSKSLVTGPTIADRIQQKKATLYFQKDKRRQEMIAEKFKKPLGNIDSSAPESASLDRGVHFPENDSMKSVFEDLRQHPYENDMYEDPEHIARRQMEHQKWIDEHLRTKNEKEKEDFIKKFVQMAYEQGYNVRWTEDMKVLLEPIDPKEQKEETPEEIKIIYE